MLLELVVIISTVILGGAGVLATLVVQGHKLNEVRENHRHELDVLATKAAHARIEVDAKQEDKQMALEQARLENANVPEKLRLRELELIGSYRISNTARDLMAACYASKHFGGELTEEASAAVAELVAENAAAKNRGYGS